MNLKEEVIKLRRKQWDAFMEKYEKRSKINKAACKFSEVNYKLFKKSVWDNEYKNSKNKNKQKSTRHSGIKTDSIKKTGKIRKNSSSSIESFDSGIIVSPSDTRYSSNDQIAFTSNWDHDAIDSGSEFDFENENETSGYYTYTTAGTDSKTIDISDDTDETENLNSELRNLIEYIEIDLQSNLKKLIFNRSVCKLLESKSLDYWHDNAKNEMKRLENYISQEGLKHYMRYCFELNNAKLIDINVVDHIIVNKLNSNFKYLLLERELAHGNEKKYLYCCKKIREEWKRLSKEFPTDILLTYGSDILLSIKKLKSE